MDNPNYDNLKPDMLLYLNDSTEYFKFTGESYYADYLYNLKGGGTRKDYELSFDVNTAINNFNIKNETMLLILALHMVTSGCGVALLMMGYLKIIQKA